MCTLENERGSERSREIERLEERDADAIVDWRSFCDFAKKVIGGREGSHDVARRRFLLERACACLSVWVCMVVCDEEFVGALRSSEVSLRAGIGPV